MLIDAHCHLDLEDFDNDREEVFERARRAGVRHFIVPGTTRARWQQVLALGEREDVSIALGLHPYFIDEHGDEDLKALEDALQNCPQPVAVGECGIDARLSDTLEQQWTLFDAQLRLAKRYDLPVIIHCVQANDKVAKRLRQLQLPRGGMVHGFAGSPEQALAFNALGFAVGLGGILTYPRARRVQRAVRALADDGFVLETDSPDMPLQGQQGQRNEPANVAEVCRQLAQLRHQPEVEVARLSCQTATQLFHLPDAVMNDSSFIDR
ncbi:MAG: TatD family hydrolase [Pseudomonadota bacterium]